MFPLFSKFKRDDPQIKSIYYLVVKFTAMVILPVSFVIILLSDPLSRIIYGVQYPYVALYLSLYLLVFIGEGLGDWTLWSLISGLGESNVTFRSSILMFVSGTVLAILLAPGYQIVGILIAMNIAPKIGWLYHVFWVKKNLNISLEWGSMARLYLAALVAFAGAFLVLNYFNFSDWLSLFVGGFSYLILYVVVLAISGALRHDDISQIRIITESIKPLKPVVDFVLSLLSLLVRN
jgi:O-antigen/teichoic acid export membrane protein